MSYARCQNAYSDGVYNIPATHPSYAPRLDSDGDGFACETATNGGRDLSDYVAPSASVSVSPSGSATALPVTGQSGGYGLVMSGLILLMVGVLALSSLYVYKPYKRRH